MTRPAGGKPRVPHYRLHCFEDDDGSLLWTCYKMGKIAKWRVVKVGIVVSSSAEAIRRAPR